MPAFNWTVTPEADASLAGTPARIVDQLPFVDARPPRYLLEFVEQSRLEVSVENLVYLQPERRP